MGSSARSFWPRRLSSVAPCACVRAGPCLSGGKSRFTEHRPISGGNVVSCISAWVTIPLSQSRANAGVSLASAQTWIDIIGPIITAVVAVLGGIFAYFKFVRGRIFRPRIDINMSAQWVKSDEKNLLLGRIEVKNIGTSKIAVKHRGTGLRVSALAADQPPAPAATVWERRKTCAILKDHDWIESGETVSDDILLNLDIAPALVKFESRIVVLRTFFSNIEISAGQIFSSAAANSINTS